MAQPYCDNCGQTFGSAYHRDLHEELDACDEPSDSTENSSQTSQSQSETQGSHTEVTTAATGTVSEFHDDRGYGFIATADVTSKRGHDEHTESIFFHISDIRTTWIDEGDRLKFDIVRTSDGLQATDISVKQRDCNRGSSDNSEETTEKGSVGFGHQKDDTRHGAGKSGPTNSDIESFQDEDKFR